MKTTTTEQFNHMLKEKTNQYRFFKMGFAGMFLLLCMSVLLTANAQKYQGKFYNNVDANGVIINGYDPVAFFTDNKPVKGNTAFTYKYEDATYQFASQDHLDLFKSNPEKYKPQFGAWCAYAVSLGRVAPIDVNTFSIVNGRLVIQHNQKAVRGWNEDVQGNLKLADKYWPKVTANGGKQIHTVADTQKTIWISVGALVSLLIIYLVISRSLKARRVSHVRRNQQGMKNRISNMQYSKMEQHKIF
ncbi:MAG: YHS domain-containing (seleno)protein [Ginsengibacter sp.]